MSEGHYEWKATRERLVRECEELGIDHRGLSNNRLSAEIRHAKKAPEPQPATDVVPDRVKEIRRRDRAAAERLVARSGRGRFAEPGGYANPRAAFNDLYGEL